MKKTIFVLLMLIMIVGVCTQSYADAEIISAAEGIYHGGSATVNDMKSIASKVLGVVQVVGYAVALIILSISGIKYMFAATAEKAKIKEQLVPYAIGAIILFGASVIIGIVSNFAQTI